MAFVQIVIQAIEKHDGDLVDFNRQPRACWMYTLSLPMVDWDEDVMGVWVVDDLTPDDPEALCRWGHRLATGRDIDGAVSWK